MTSNTTRIIAWNRKRNNLKFDEALEHRLLMEEIREFYTAEDLASMVQEHCDLLFVWEGTKAKWACGVHGKLPCTMNSHWQWFKCLEEFVNKVKREQQSIIGSELYEKGNSTAFDIDKCLEFVIIANEQKGVEKDEHGKVKKGGTYTPPLERIREYLRQCELA